MSLRLKITIKHVRLVLMMCCVFLLLGLSGYWLMNTFYSVQVLDDFSAEYYLGFSVMRYGFYFAVFLGWPYLIRQRCRSLGVTKSSTLRGLIQYRFRLLLYIAVFEILVVLKGFQYVIGWVI